MKSYSKYAIAASLAVLAIGVPATIRYMQEYQPVAEIPQKPADARSTGCSANAAPTVFADSRSPGRAGQDLSGCPAPSRPADDS